MLRIRGAAHNTRPDTVAAEEPLEIRLAGTPLAVTMRTPGDDFDLVHGFLATEAVIGSADDIAGLRYCNSVDEDGRNTYNVVDVDLAPGVEPPDTALDRNFYTSSSCGVCGKASIDAIRTRTRHDVAGDDLRLPLAGHVLMVSGRASFELTQKAAMAGIPVLAAVSAPSSLAVELAADVGITLVGFLRGDGCNVYTRPERIVLPD